MTANKEFQHKLDCVKTAYAEFLSYKLGNKNLREIKETVAYQTFVKKFNGSISNWETHSLGYEVQSGNQLPLEMQFIIEMVAIIESEVNYRQTLYGKFQN